MSAVVLQDVSPASSKTSVPHRHCKHKQCSICPLPSFFVVLTVRVLIVRVLTYSMRCM